MAKVITMIACISSSLALIQCFSAFDLEFAPTHQEVSKEFAQGGGKQYDAAQYSSGGEKGEKGYAAHHHQEKGAKGEHEKEGAKKQFAEEGGHKKGHHHQDGYYAQGHQGHKGQKGYHFVDEGSYAKGHSTKGHHNIHKLDEYKKNTDFYDEDHDEAHKEKHGKFEASKSASGGAHNKGGYAKKSFYDGGFGNFGRFLKGSHYFDDKGHDKAQGQKVHYSNGAEFAKKGENDAFKQFGFAHQTHH